MTTSSVVIKRVDCTQLSIDKSNSDLIAEIVVGVLTALTVNLFILGRTTIWNILPQKLDISV